MEQDNKIPFLDIEIIRKNESLKTKVYGKPSNILSYVHFFSNHHSNLKTSVFISMYLRAYRVSDTEYLEEELNFIKKISENLKYPSSFINQCHATAKRRFHQSKVNIKEHTKDTITIILPFHKILLYVIPLLKKLNVRVIFKYENAIGKSLKKNSPPSSSRIVYKIPCKSCNKFYIGQTGKYLKTRILRHK